MKNVIKVVMVIMGTLIGAGFASGREIYLFFGKYGMCGIARDNNIWNIQCINNLYNIKNNKR